MPVPRGRRADLLAEQFRDAVRAERRQGRISSYRTRAEAMAEHHLVGTGEHHAAQLGFARRTQHMLRAGDVGALDVGPGRLPRGSACKCSTGIDALEQLRPSGIVDTEIGRDDVAAALHVEQAKFVCTGEALLPRECSSNHSGHDRRLHDTRLRAPWRRSGARRYPSAHSRSPCACARCPSACRYCWRRG